MISFRTAVLTFATISIPQAKAFEPTSNLLLDGKKIDQKAQLKKFKEMIKKPPSGSAVFELDGRLCFDGLPELATEGLENELSN